MHALILTAALLASDPLDEEQPPWRPFPAERDVADSVARKVTRVIGITGLVVGGLALLAGTLLAAPATLVAGGTARALSVLGFVPVQDPTIEQGRQILMLVASIAAGVLFVSGIILVAGGLSATVGLLLTVYSAMMV